MAEALTRRRLEEAGLDDTYIVSSAGVAALSGGEASRHAHEVMQSWGLSLEGHSSSQVDDELISRADLIVAMTISHREALLARWPWLSRHRVVTLKQLVRTLRAGPAPAGGDDDGDNDGDDIVDPFGGSFEIYETVAHEIDEAVEAIISNVSELEELLKGAEPAMRVAIGSDHAGAEYKTEVAHLLNEMGYQVEDMGTYSIESVDYPDFARRVAEAVAGGGADRGILICGTGIGMSMAANKARGIRAALCHDTYSARMSRAHNDANVLCVGARVIGRDILFEIVKVWIGAGFEGGRHQRRVDKIMEIEE